MPRKEDQLRLTRKKAMLSKLSVNPLSSLLQCVLMFILFGNYFYISNNGIL
jgi:hypothetical protein